MAEHNRPGSVRVAAAAARKRWPIVTMPTFLIIGAAKTGTTSMYEYLQQHPDIFMSAVKEPWHFASHAMRRWTGPDGDWLQLRARYLDLARMENYEALFEGGTHALARGEASAIYLHTEGCAERIRAALPDARLMVLFRDPVDRAFSQFKVNLQQNRETAGSFAEAVRLEEERIRQGWSPDFHYVRRGFYYRQLEPYLRLFPREHLRIYLYEDIVKDTAVVVRDAYAFLGVDPDFTPDTERRYNISGTPARAALPRLLRGASPVAAFVRCLVPKVLRQPIRLRLKRVAEKKIVVDPQTRADLIKEYRPDILKLQEMLGRDLGPWMS